MALPTIGDGEQIGDGNVNETLVVGRSDQAVQLGNGTGGVRLGSAVTSKVGFYGTTPIVQRSGADQAALTLTTGVSGGAGFTTVTAFNAAVALLVEVRAALVALGAIKGSS